MTRYLTWDEAVFFSQSGGVAGAAARPMKLVASREIGSSVLVGVLRFFGEGIAEVRFLWGTLCFLLLVWGARRLIRHIGNRGALTLLFVFGSSWVVWAYTLSFYSNVFAAVLTLLAATYYLDIIRPRNDQVSTVTGFLAGLFMAGAFAMRPLESTLVAVALGIHLLVFNATLLRTRFRPIGVAVLTLLIAGGVPWIVDSIDRFGSIGGRVEAGLSQGGQTASSLRWNGGEYLGALVGDSVATLPGGPVPNWPSFVIYGVMLAGFIAIAIALYRARLGALRGPAGVFLVASLSNAGFFLLWRAAVEERYSFITMIFAVALLGWAVATLAPRRPSRLLAGGAVAVALLWLVANIATMSAYETIRDDGLERSARVAYTMRTLASDGPCKAMSRYGAPQIEVGSGCTTKSYTEWEDVLAFAEGSSEGVPMFVYGPAGEESFVGLPDGWSTIAVPREGGARASMLAFWIPPS